MPVSNQERKTSDLNLLLQHKEDQLALAIHLANANAVPLCPQMISLLTEFVTEKKGQVEFQRWIEGMARSRQQQQEEDLKYRSRSMISLN